MAQRLLHRDVLKLVLGKLAKGAAGSGQPDAADFLGRSSAHALVDGVVLGVNGQQGHVAAARLPGKDLPGSHHGLFVGQGLRVFLPPQRRR